MKNKYNLMVFIGFMIWILGTWYGGWQDKASTPLEHITDIVGWLLVMWGVIGDITTNLSFVKNNYTNVTLPDSAEVNIHRCSGTK